MARALVPGTVRQIWTSDEVHMNKVLQVIEVGTFDKSRIKYVLSDGEYYQQALIDLPPYSQSIGRVKEFSLVLIMDYRLQVISPGLRIVIVTRLQCLWNSDHIIGNPQILEILGFSKPFSDEQQEVPPTPSQIGPEPYTPIKSLTPMNQDFVVKAKVVLKEPLRSWCNSMSTGRLFFCMLMDAEGSLIQATFFNDAADMFTERLKVGCVYSFNQGYVRASKVKRHYPTEHPFQLTFDHRTVVNELQDDFDFDSQFKIVQISQIETLPVHSKADICAVVIEDSGLIKKDGNSSKYQVSRRVLKLIDQSKGTLKLTLLGSFALGYDVVESRLPRVVLAKGLVVSSRLELKSVASSLVLYDDGSYPAVEAMQQWRDSCLGAEALKSTQIDVLPENLGLSTISEIKELNESKSRPVTEQSYRIHATICSIDHQAPQSMWETVCINRGCSSRVKLDHNYLYRCESCEVSLLECEFVYRLKVHLKDMTDSVWVTVSDDIAIALMGIKAVELAKLTDQRDGLKQLEILCSSLCYELLELTIKVGRTVIQRKPALNYSVTSMSKLNHKLATEIYMEEIAEALADTAYKTYSPRQPN